MNPVDSLPEPQQYTQEEIYSIVAENKQLKDNYSYDNEWIKFLAVLAENESLGDIVDFIEKTKWTDRQKSKIMAYSKIMLGRGLSTTYITGITDYRKLYDDYTLVECLLPLGMTRFDMTQEFVMLISMIKYHFGIEVRRSKGGHFIERIGTQRTELVHDNTTRRTPEGFKEAIWKRLGGE